MTTTEKLFEIATRKKYRFPSVQGLLDLEAVWDLPLTTTNSQKASLDNVAKAVNSQLKSQEEESFVTVDPKTESSPYTRLSNMLDILKYIIKVKQDEKLDLENEARRKQERNFLLEVKADKEKDAVKNLSVEEIDARLKEL